MFWQWEKSEFYRYAKKTYLASPENTSDAFLKILLFYFFNFRYYVNYMLKFYWKTGSATILIDRRLHLCWSKRWLCVENRVANRECSCIFDHFDHAGRHIRHSHCKYSKMCTFATSNNRNIISKNSLWRKKIQNSN